jgi:hypothetical protein
MSAQANAAATGLEHCEQDHAANKACPAASNTALLAAIRAVLLLCYCTNKKLQNHESFALLMMSNAGCHCQLML